MHEIRTKSKRTQKAVTDAAKIAKKESRGSSISTSDIYALMFGKGVGKLLCWRFVFSSTRTALSPVLLRIFQK